MHRLHRIPITLLVCAALTRCLDTTPIVLPKNVITDASIPDADPNPACRTCIDAPGCESEFEACRSAAPCMEIFDCAYARGCAFKTTEGLIVSCGATCADGRGLDFDSPAIVSILALVGCALPRCIPACAGTD